jgi:hypothetical protein
MFVRLVISITGVALLALSSTPALALTYGNSEPAATPTGGTTSETNAKPTTEHATVTQPKLDQAKVRVCQNHEKFINDALSRVANRGQSRLDLFTTIATRVETFYMNKGKALSNYDALVADVNTKKASAQAAVDAVKATSGSFSCDVAAPKGSISSFKDAWKTEVSALEAYRTAVKNLIVGVKSVQSTTEGGTQ